VRAVRAFIRTLERAEAQEARKEDVEKRRKDSKEDEEREGRADYYRALLSRLSERAYPSDRFDTETVRRAIAGRSRIRPALGLGRTSSGQRRGPFALQDTERWEFVGPKALSVPYRVYYGPEDSAITGRVGGLAFHPTDPKTVYLAASAGGLWKTTDGGQNWAAIGDGFPVPYTSSVAVHPTDPETVFVGQGDFAGFLGSGLSQGIQKSTDGGATWKTVAPETAGAAVSSIVIDPTDTNIVLASTARGDLRSSNGIFRSTDGGETWNAVDGAFSGNTVEEIEIGAAQSDGVRPYFAVSGDTLYRSTDRGQTWSAISAPGTGRKTLAVSDREPNVVYIQSDGDQSQWRGVLDARSGRFRWANISGNFPGGYNWSQSWYDNHLKSVGQLVSGTPRDVLYSGLITFAGSKGASGSWTDIGQTYGNALTHNDQHTMAVFPGDPNTMAIGNDGGVYGLTYAPARGTWRFDTSWNRTLGLTMFYDAAFHPSDPNVMIGGAQDNASPASFGDLSQWGNPGAGDGCGCAINQLNPLIQYNSAQFQALFRTSDGWISGGGFTPDWGTDRVPFIGRIALDPNTPNLLYAGTNYLWRWNESTFAWTSRLGNTELAPAGQVRAIAVAPGRSTRIYVGTTDGRLWTSGDRGATWVKLSEAGSLLPNRAVTSIDVHPFLPGELLVTVSGTDNADAPGGHVYAVHKADTTEPEAEDISGNLPNVPANSITRDWRDPDGSYFVGTDIGVFSTTDGGGEWLDATAPLGLPQAEVATIKTVPGTGYLMVATYGRGIWRLKLDTPSDEVNEDDAVVTAIAMRLRRDGDRVRALITLRNTGVGTARQVRAEAGYLQSPTGVLRTTSTLPVDVGLLPGRSTKSVIVDFTLPAKSGRGRTLVKIRGTYQGGATPRRRPWDITGFVAL
jgi:photosystem II stability/assembly factor-like uncharacterized protein